jgi:hypothetical protein
LKPKENKTSLIKLKTMPHCIEAFIQDVIWEWLHDNEKYTDISGEIKVGTGINSGRIDLIAKTKDGDYHGFEVKNKASADQQLNRYVCSESLDKVFHCSRNGQRIANHLEKQPNDRSTYASQQIRKKVSNAIAAGQYTKQEYTKKLKETFSESLLQEEAHISQRTDRILNESEKTVEARLTQNLGIPTADFDPSETYIGLDEAMTRMKKNLLIPQEIGVLNVQLEFSTNNTDKDNYRMELKRPINESFSKQKSNTVQVIREADSLNRTQRPELSNENEAWIQHHVWRVYGCIREAVVPNAEDNSEYLIDVMGFEGCKTPAEVYKTNPDAKLIGIEAKGEATLTNRNEIENIRGQLNRYRQSGVITHLYLAVPKKYTEVGNDIIATKDLIDVGLMSVSQAGTVEIIQDAKRVEMEFDSYIKNPGSHEYTRSIGFGKILPPEEPVPVSPCRVD